MEYSLLGLYKLNGAAKICTLKLPGKQPHWEGLSMTWGSGKISPYPKETQPVLDKDQEGTVG